MRDNKAQKRQVGGPRSDNWELHDELRKINDENKKMTQTELGRSSHDRTRPIAKLTEMDS